MGFLDKLFGGKKKQDKRPAAPPSRSPSRSIINDPDLGTIADFNRYYPLPEGYEYRERGQRDVVVVRKSDGAEFVFLVEEGILGFDIPRQRQDGSWGKKTTEVLKQGGSGPHVTPASSQLGFPLGKNIISDPDIKSFAELKRYYPLPQGFEYQQTEEGVPVIVRPADGQQFNFLIEEELLSFDEPYTRENGKIGYKTTEVFKKGKK
jgi:hypothetical protein